MACRICGLMVRIGMALVMGVALIVNPILDDVVSGDARAAVVRDELVVSLPPQLTGRIASAPVAERTENRDLRTKLSFLYQDEPRSIPIEITQEDLRYDVDIASVWAGSEYERSRRVRTFVTQYSNSPMIESMARELRKIREDEGLSRREYAEMIVAMVQSIPYGTPPGTQARAPVRVILDDQGDCDEKAFLGAALLAHEGFPTALFEFAEEQHAGLGITREYWEPFPGTEYAYVETTESLPLGEWSTLVGPDGTEVELESEPLVIPIDGLEIAAD